jgi:hypothetical protein
MMKTTTLVHRKMALLTFVGLVLLTSAVHAQTITTALDDLILGFYATGAPGKALNLEVDLGSISNFYNATGSFTLPALAVQDLVDTYGASWSTRTDLFWGAVSTTGRAAGTADGHAPVGTLWATAPDGATPFNRGTVFAQKAASPNIEAMIVAGAAGSLYGAPTTTNSAFAAVIANSSAGSWSVQDQKTLGTSFGYFNPTVDNTANIPAGGQVVSDLYELQPANTSGLAGTLLGKLVLTQSGLSFQAASTFQDPFVTWQYQYFTSEELDNPAFSGPNADPLGKGISNTNQFLVGLNPTNPASVFGIISGVSTGANFVITWKTAGIRTNVLQATNGRLGVGYSNNFQDISGPIIINVVGDTTTNYTDVGGATNRPVRFYRIRLGP